MLPLFLLRHSHSFRSFFFLTIPPPPRSTLFPSRRSSDLCVRSLPARRGSIRMSRASRRRSATTPIGRGCERDRKSTRLNSSHRCISYAVFCLKKKKKLKLHIDSIYVHIVVSIDVVVEY